MTFSSRLIFTILKGQHAVWQRLGVALDGSAMSARLRVLQNLLISAMSDERR